jgi:hypothetical protein
MYFLDFYAFTVILFEPVYSIFKYFYFLFFKCTFKKILYIQCCQVAVVTATFLKCGSLKKLMAVVNL